MLTLAELAVLALAGYRATQMVVWDSLFDGVRDRIRLWHADRPESKAREMTVTLMSCPYCSGWWLAGAILVVYLAAAGRWDAAPLLVHGVEWLAVAGGAVLLNRWDDTRPSNP